MTKRQMTKKVMIKEKFDTIKNAGIIKNISPQVNEQIKDAEDDDVFVFEIDYKLPITVENATKITGNKSFVKALIKNEMSKMEKPKEKPKFEKLKDELTKICSQYKHLKISSIPKTSSKVQVNVSELGKRTTIQAILKLGKIKQKFECKTRLRQDTDGKTIYFKLDKED